jgi:hypothetical protein
MRFFRVLTGVTVAAALSWTAFANAQTSGAEESAESDNSGAQTSSETEAPTEIPEELFRDPVMDEIIVVAGPQGQTPFELEMEREEQSEFTHQMGLQPASRVTHASRKRFYVRHAGRKHEARDCLPR